MVQMTKVYKAERQGPSNSAVLADFSSVSETSAGQSRYLYRWRLARRSIDLSVKTIMGVAPRKKATKIASPFGDHCRSTSIYPARIIMEIRALTVTPVIRRLCSY